MENCLLRALEAAAPACAGSSLGWCIIDGINRPGAGVRSERDGWINNAVGGWFGVSFLDGGGYFYLLHGANSQTVTPGD